MRPTQANALIHNHVTETYHILSGAGSIESRGCSKSIETYSGSAWKILNWRAASGGRCVGLDALSSGFS